MTKKLKSVDIKNRRTSSTTPELPPEPKGIPHNLNLDGMAPGCSYYEPDGVGYLQFCRRETDIKWPELATLMTILKLSDDYGYFPLRDRDLLAEELKIPLSHVRAILEKLFEIGFLGVRNFGFNTDETLNERIYIRQDVEHMLQIISIEA